MNKRHARRTASVRGRQIPVIVERDEEGFFVVECPLFRGCYSQGKTLDTAIKNIREVIALCLEEEENRYRMASYHSHEFSMHTLTV